MLEEETRIELWSIDDYVKVPRNTEDEGSGELFKAVNGWDITLEVIGSRISISKT